MRTLFILLLGTVLSSATFAQSNFSWTINGHPTESGQFSVDQQFFYPNVDEGRIYMNGKKPELQIQLDYLNDRLSVGRKSVQVVVTISGKEYVARIDTTAGSPSAIIIIRDTLTGVTQGSISSVWLQSQGDSIQFSCTFRHEGARMTTRLAYANAALKNGDTILTYSNEFISIQGRISLSDSLTLLKQYYSRHGIEARTDLLNMSKFELVTFAPWATDFNWVFRVPEKSGLFEVLVRPGLGTNLAGDRTSIPDTVRFFVRVTQRSYTMKCSGAETITFDASANTAATDSTIIGFEHAGFNSLHGKGLFLINNFLKFRGDLLIDTVTNQITSTGEWFVDTVVLPLGGIGRFHLYNADNSKTNFLGYGCNLAFVFLKSGVNKLTSSLIGGNKFRLDSIGFTPTGLKLGVTIELPFKATQCADTTGKDNPSEIGLAPLLLQKAGLGGTLKVKGFGFAPTFCLKDLTIAYYRERDSFFISADFTTPISPEPFGLEAQWMNGSFDGAGFKLQLPTPVPIASTGLGVRGLRGSVYGFGSTPIRLKMGGTVSEVPPVDLLQLDADFSFESPSKLQGKLGGKLMKAAGFWQGEGSFTTTLDWTKSLKLSGVSKFGSLGNGYALEGNAELTYAWRPTAALTGKASGSVSLPKLSTKLDVIADWVNTYLPLTIARAEAQLKERRLRMNLQYYFFSGNVAIDLNKQFGQDGFFQYGWGNIPLASKRSAGKHSTASLRSFTITDEMHQIFFRINGAGTSTLKDPSGITYSNSTSDSLILFSNRGDRSFWFVNDPKPGKWELDASGEIEAVATLKQKPFEISSSQVGDDLTVTWNDEGYDPSSTVEVFLDDATLDSNGVSIGMARASDGQFHYHLTDSLSDCEFRVYAIRDDRGALSTAYSPTAVTVVQRTFSQPTIAYATYNSNDRGVIDIAAPATKEPVSHYLIIIRSQGVDSSYAEVRPADLPASFHIVGAENKQVIVMAVGDGGIHSCPSEPISFAFTKVERGTTTRQVSKIAIFPNPADDRLTIKSEEPLAQGVIEVFDLLGERHMIESVTFDNEAQAEIDLSTLAPGDYFVRATTAAGISTSRLRIAER